MNTEQLRQIVREKNEQRERVAVRTAEDIIESIVKGQQGIAAAQTRIQKLREELTKLQVEQLDDRQILGGE